MRVPNAVPGPCLKCGTMVRPGRAKCKVLPPVPNSGGSRELRNTHCARAIKTTTCREQSARAESPGGLAGTGNDLGSVPGLVDEVSAAPDAPHVAPIAVNVAIGGEAAGAAEVAAGGAEAAEALEAELDGLMELDDAEGVGGVAAGEAEARV